MNLLEPSFTNDIIWTIINLFAITIAGIVASKGGKHD
jgi:hypothetical protein